MLRIHQVLKSSRAAIDLASIMVGIIIIGLIGGVIAATVFAVIPWAQDNAAKQQLDGVASAESAYRGLSTSKDANLQNAVASPTSQSDPNQVVLNSTFTGSVGLAVNNLLTLNAAGSYCVIATTDGKDYHAYSKSGSGKWFYITSGKTQPSTYTGSTPCLTTGAAAGTVDTAIDNGSGAVPTAPANSGGGSGTTPPASNPAILGTYSFEDGTIKGWSADTGVNVVSVQGIVNSGTRSIYAGRPSSTATFTNVNFDPSVVSPAVTFVPGKNYTVEAWVYRYDTKNAPRMFVGGQTSDVASQNSSWNKLSVTFTATDTTSKYISFETTALGSSTSTNNFRVDDITITQNN